MELSIYIYLIFGITLLAGLAVLELVSRKTNLPKAVVRKAGHVGLALVIAGAAWLWHKEMFIPIGFGFTIIALALRQLPLKSLGAFKSSSYGEVLFPLGVGLAALIAPIDSAFIATILILGIADTAAYSIGTRLSSPRLFGSKTLAGTIAFAVVSAIIIYCSTTVIWFSICAAIALAATELFSKWGSDNVSVPLAGSLLFLLLG